MIRMTDTVLIHLPDHIQFLLSLPRLKVCFVDGNCVCKILFLFLKAVSSSFFPLPPRTRNSFSSKVKSLRFAESCTFTAEMSEQIHEA